QVTNVAAGSAGTDAVNVDQLNAAVGALGGGPTTGYVDSGDAAAVATAQSYADAGDAATLVAANAYTDSQIAGASAGAITTATTYTDTQVDIVRTEAATGDAATLESANTYTDARSATTLSSANAYTDTRFATLGAFMDDFDLFRGEVDRRLVEQDERIDRQGAMSAAMMQMGINAGGARSQRGRVAVGVGFQGSESALSDGWARPLGSRGSISLGGAFSGSESSAGIGFGMDL